MAAIFVHMFGTGNKTRRVHCVSTNYNSRGDVKLQSQTTSYTSSQHLATENVAGSSSQQILHHTVCDASISFAHFMQARCPNGGGLSTPPSLSPIITPCNFVNASILRSMDSIPTFKMHAVSGQIESSFPLWAMVCAAWVITLSISPLPWIVEARV